MKLTRADLVKSAAKRPLHKLRWHDVRGTAREISRACTIAICEGGKAVIMKDRNGIYLNTPRDENGLVNESDL